MIFKVLDSGQQAELLKQRLFMHEKAFFETQVQLEENKDVMLHLSGEELAMAQKQDIALNARLSEINLRITTVLRILGVEPKPEEPEQEQVEE